MSSKIRVLAALFCTTLGACNRSCSCDRKAPVANLPDAAITEARVTIMSTGREPRARLEVGRWSGFSARMTVETEGSLSIQGQVPVKVPAAIATLRLDTLRGIGDPIIRNRNGRELRLIEERGLIEKIELKPGQFPPEVLAKLNETFRALSGTTMRQLVAEDGEVVELTTELVGGVQPAPEHKRVLDGAWEMQRRFPFRIPSEPVGPGARWRFSELVEYQGIRTIQIADMTLTALDDSTARIRIALRHQAPRQELPHPLDPRQTAVLEHYRGDAEGELTIDRTTALQLEARLATTVNLRLTAQADGGQQSLVAIFMGVTRTRSLPLVDAGAQPGASPTPPSGSGDVQQPAAPAQSTAP